MFQNYSECYHCPLLHPQLDKLSPSDSGRNDLCEGPFLGGYSELRHHGGSLTTTGASARAPLGEVDGDDLDRVYYYTIFPSLLLSLHRDYVMAHVVQPVAPDRTRVTCAWLFDPAAMAAPDFDPSDAVDFWDLTNRQDWAINELTQLGTASRAYTPARTRTPKACWRRSTGIIWSRCTSGAQRARRRRCGRRGRRHRARAARVDRRHRDRDVARPRAARAAGVAAR